MDTVGFMKKEKEFKIKEILYLEKIKEKILSSLYEKNNVISFRFLMEKDLSFLFKGDMNLDFLKKILEKKYFIEKPSEKNIIKSLQTVESFFKNSLRHHWTLFILNGSIVPNLSNYRDSPYQIKSVPYTDDLSSHISGVVDVEDAFSYLMQLISKKIIYIKSHKNSFPKKTLYIFNIASGSKKNNILNLNYCRYFLKVSQGSKIKIVEIFISIDHFSYFTTRLFTCKIEKNSSLLYNKINLENDHNLHYSYYGSFLKRNSLLQYNDVSLGSKDSQNKVKIYLNGCKSKVVLNNTSLQKNSETNSNHTSVNHVRPFGESEQTYNMISLDESTVDLKNIIHISPESPFSSGKIVNKNLIFGKHSKISSLPQLDIYNKESYCSHEVTIGNIDEELIFYFRSRGISKNKSKEIIIISFFKEILDNMHTEFIKNKILELISKEILKNFS
ncbi:hypothetical protein AOQ87_02050 [Candidatus Riesia pediculischaeffi]|uniref:SUF system FeS cluster assembly SufBD core domain-containing protein n=2 Tax=Candidatus Riesia pediculischaeffi TaxID=428411 RepID=A0A1V0HKT4_9ENTR|nr:hypothetical protein AOQ87_02050 [Candidatus Riesia pediculischaeffi]